MRGVIHPEHQHRQIDRLSQSQRQQTLTGLYRSNAVLPTGTPIHRTSLLRDQGPRQLPDQGVLKMADANPRHRRLVIPVALGALILIVVLAAVL